MQIDPDVGEEAHAWAKAVRRVCVVGAGAMGEGIAQSFAEAGCEVDLTDISADALSRCHGQVAQNLAAAGDLGLLCRPAEETLARIRLIQTTEPEDAARGADVVVETVPEVLTLKRSLFARLDTLPPEVLIGSNTGSMTLRELTHGLTTARRMVGLHYFNPAHIIPAVEIHRGPETEPAAILRARALVERSGKAAVVVDKEIPGLVINRLTAALMREIGYLLDEDVISAEDLDAGVKATLGFRLGWIGPMEGSDFTGLDIGARVQAALFPDLSNRTAPSRALLDRVERGDLGVKAGRGWYDYAGQSREALLNARNAKLLAQLLLRRDLEEGR